MKLLHIFLCTYLIYLCESYKPVIIIHGVWDEKNSLDFLAERIHKSHEGTEVYVLNVLHGWRSLAPMWTQVKAFYTNLIPIILNHSQEEFNIIGYSQGGLVSRGLIESFGCNVSTFISLSSPQGGQYGDAFLHLIYPNLIKETVYELFYSTLGQEVSIANYWNDPYHQKLYYEYSDYLPYINNEKEHLFSNDYKKNFENIKKLVLIGGPDDGVITPWQSSQFSYYEENSENITNYKDRNLYLNDTFGLRTLDEKGRLVVHEVPGVYHTDWHHNVTVIDKYILPYLD